MSEATLEKPIDRSWPQFKEERFIPLVADSINTLDPDFHNCIQVFVDLSKESSLMFDSLEKEIDEVMQKNKLIFFVLDLKLKKTQSSFFNEVQYESIRLGLKVFQEKILKKYLDHVFAIGFTFGKLTDLFVDSKLELNKIYDYLITTYKDFKLHFGFDPLEIDQHVHDPKVKKEIGLYLIGLISEYLHRLASVIQEPIEIYAFFDFKGSSELDVLQFISQERFPYIRIGLEGCNIRSLGLNIRSGKMCGGGLNTSQHENFIPTTGLVFPSDHKLTLEGEKEFKKLIDRVIQLDLPFFVLYEDFMTENWQNLEQIIVHAKFCDRLIKRKCQGFAAAQGKVVVFDGQIDVFDEIEFDLFEEEIKALKV